MKALHKAIGAALVCVLVTVSYFTVSHLWAQGAPQTLTATTISTAQSLTATTISLATATGFSQSAGSIAVPSSSAGAFIIYVDREAERVTGGSGLVWQVQRGWASTARAAHANAAKVWFGLEGQFQSSDPPMGACTSPIAVVPWINMLTGNSWVCRSSAWQGTSPVPLTYNSNIGQTTITP